VQGNLEFTEEKDQAKIKNSKTLQDIAELLEVDASDAEKAICSRVVAGGKQVVEKGHSIEEAKFGRDAFAKVSFLVG